jgi:hypothetical protein
LSSPAAGWLGPSLLEHRKEAAEKKKRRAEKFEELVAAIYEFDHWLDRQNDIIVHGEQGTIEVSPFAKIQAISAVYFPQFDDKIAELDRATLGYRVWMGAAGEKRLMGDTAGMRGGFNEAYLPYGKKRNALLTALKEFARSEFQ